MLLVALPLFLGVLIYMLWRGLWYLDADGRFFPLCEDRAPDIVIYNLPDGLYAFSLFQTFYMIWKQKALTWCLTLWLLLVVSEVLQSNHWLTGTYDVADLWAYTLAGIAAWLFSSTIFKPLKKAT